MTTTTQKSLMKSQYPNTNLWHSINVALPCIRPAIAPSFSVGFRSYHGHPPDSC
ncbi:hypothetical protein [Pyxidicoccus xibeiensis]|uniref:hypothetical protein n=1 Tax=Pyxidicoccus xibeiensis TaxID=2906759 RepID=UPI0020A78B37|nr:hypothetical protein [Pyxidicoccus xibeiensis]MCP3138821.1 hypothetical protein [Pyxidicoccus xibeiensis]